RTPLASIPYQLLQPVNRPVQVVILELEYLCLQQMLDRLILHGEGLRRPKKRLSHEVSSHVCAIRPKLRRPRASIDEDNEVDLRALGEIHVWHRRSGQLDRRLARSARRDLQPPYLGKELRRRRTEAYLMTIASHQ